MTRMAEMTAKLARLRRWLPEAGLEAVVLRTRANFAWLTAGGRSMVNEASALGVGTLLVTRDRVILLANNIEAQRLVEEELAGLDVEVAEYPWHDASGEAGILRRILGEAKMADRGVAVDAGDGGRLMDAAISALRQPLLPAEIARYRALGQLVAALTEDAARQVAPGMTEDDVRAMAWRRFAEHGVRLSVGLVAADDRIDTRRHPISTGRPIKRRFMLVTCAERDGLWVSVTRLVNFQPIDDTLAARHRACCAVDAAAIAATRPGRTLGAIFADIQNAYARHGFPDQWRYHHQGGPTGYAPREALARPEAPTVVQADQPFAWNPSITGTKSEDTVLIHDEGFEWITRPGDDWPTVTVEHDGQAFTRADILHVG